MDMGEMELQQKYMQYQMFEQQMNQLQQQIHQIQQQFMELEYIKRSLEEYANVDPDKEILCPLSSGIFVKAKIVDPSNFLVNVGANVVVKKDLKGALELMGVQEKELQKGKDKMEEQYAQVAESLQQMEQELMPGQ